MKKTMRRLSILLAIIGIGILLLAGTLNFNSILWIIGTVMLIVGALMGAFLGENTENNIGSYRTPRV